jgi:hypothetical protein
MVTDRLEEDADEGLAPHRGSKMIVRFFSFFMYFGRIDQPA